MRKNSSTASSVCPEAAKRMRNINHTSAQQQAVAAAARRALQQEEHKTAPSVSPAGSRLKNAKTRLNRAACSHPAANSTAAAARLNSGPAADMALQRAAEGTPAVCMAMLPARKRSAVTCSPSAQAAKRCAASCPAHSSKNAACCPLKNKAQTKSCAKNQKSKLQQMPNKVSLSITAAAPRAPAVQCA